MDGRWPVLGSAAVLLDMDTLPDPTDFYQAWTRRLMNDKTDTLDAISRVREALALLSESVHSIANATRSTVNNPKWRRHPDTAHMATMLEVYETWAGGIDVIIGGLPDITALSNQGEGAVVGAYWDTLNDCPMLGRDLESPRFQPLFRGAGDGRRDSYKHGWINSALWAGRNDLISDIESPAYIKARDEVLGKLATEAEADRRDADHD